MSNDQTTKQPLAAIQRVNPATLGLPQGPIKDLSQVQDALGHAAHQRCNLLAPVTRIEFIPPGFQIALRVVAFSDHFTQAQWNDDKSNGTWYRVDGGKLALHRSALDQLASAAGISSVGPGCSVELVEANYWRAKHTVSVRTFDGQRRQITRHVEVDLRDGSPEAQAAGRGLKNARKFGSRLADSKAANRAIRAALGIQGAYTREQAQLPFVFPVLIWTPDPEDKEIARMTAAVELGIADQVYGRADGGSAPLLADPGNVIDDDQLETLTAGANGRERERVPAHPDDEPAWARDTPAAKAATPWPPCGACGAEITEALANQTEHLPGGPFCTAHDPRNRG